MTKNKFRVTLVKGLGDTLAITYYEDEESNTQTITNTSTSMITSLVALL